MYTNNGISPINEEQPDTDAPKPAAQSAEAADSSGISIDTTVLAQIASVLTVGALLMLKDREVRDACNRVFKDIQLRQVCKEAGQMVGRELLDALRRNGVPAAVKNALTSVLLTKA